MDEVRIEYYYEGLRYDFNSAIINPELMQSLDIMLQARCSFFAKEINEQNGYLKAVLSEITEDGKGLHVERTLPGLSEELNMKINDYGLFHI